MNKDFTCFELLPVRSCKQISYTCDFMSNEAREHEGIQAAAETLHPSGCVGAHMSLCSDLKVETLFMGGVCCIWRRMGLLLRQWGCKDDWTKEGRDKRLKVGGGSGCEPTLSRAFCNQRQVYYPHKSTITVSSGPQGTRNSSEWPTSVLCLADGRRRCPSGSSWSLRWNPCSRLGNLKNKINGINKLVHCTTCRVQIRSEGQGVCVCTRPVSK